MYLITKWFGTFLLDKKEIIDKILFEKNAVVISNKLRKIKNQEILTEEKKLSKGKKVIVCEKRLLKIGDYKPTDPFLKKIEINPEDFGFTNVLLQKVSILLSKTSIEDKLESEDLQVIQMINTLDDLIQTTNLLSERLDCWSDISISGGRIKPLENVFYTINKEMKIIEKQIDKDMIRIAPNISKITGPLIGARLISIAGGLERLAMLPASTIQILGAEKALFRYKKEGGKPPKHGVIFQHSYINKANRSHRGKIARVFATKISTAAKADAFTKRDISKDLIDNLKIRIKEIRNL